jgi:hypothetical protein
MTVRPQSAAAIVNGAEGVLALAESGLDAVRAGMGKRRMAGLWNVAIFGPVVPMALGRLKTVTPDFEGWFAPYRTALETDVELRRFATFRQQVARTEPSGSRFGAWFGGRGSGLPTGRKDLGPKPPNATRYFLRDARDGAGWEIRLPDGTTEKYYVELPELLSVTLFAGERVGPRSLLRLCEAYVDVLRRLVHDARERFGTDGNH